MAIRRSSWLASHELDEVTSTNTLSLVLAKPNASDAAVLDDLATDAPNIHPTAVGDVLAPRPAVAAIYLGRVLGQAL